jgi:hypothetical protein
MIALQKENGDDPDMAEMIASELESLSDQLAELEERLTVGMPDIFDLYLLKYFSLRLPFHVRYFCFQATL